MATLKVRHLISRPGASGLPRYFWQPSAPLRAQGWRPERVPLDWGRYTDAGALLAAAIARAEELNAQLDTARATTVLAATRGPAPAATRTIRDLIITYQQDEAWQRLSPVTQRGYRQCMKLIEAWAGDAPVRAIDTVRVQNLRAAFRQRPAYGNAVVRVLRLLLGWARLHGWVTTNAAERPGLLGTAPSGLLWPRQAVVDFVAQADAAGWPSVGTAVLLNEWLGQREADLLRMPRSVYRDGALLITQRKTGAGVALPLDMVATLRERLAAELARARATVATTILVNDRTGRPWNEHTFRHVFSTIRARLEARSYELEHLLPGRDMADPEAFTVRARDLTFMHLRHTAITRLGEAGCAPNEIAAISGHSLKTVTDILERYLVRTATVARVAFQRRLDAEAGTERSRNTKV